MSLVALASNHGEVCGLPVILSSVTALQSAREDVTSMKVGLGHIAGKEDAEVWFASHSLLVVLELACYEQRAVVLCTHSLCPCHVALI